MPKLPAGANLDYLKKQAKALLRQHRGGDPGARARFARSLPAAEGGPGALELRLHDAQSCVAREYGFPSWAALRDAVEATALARGDRATLVRRFLHLAYGGDATGSYDAARPGVAAQLLHEHPDLPSWDPFVACAAGRLDAVIAAAAEPGWVNRPGGPLDMPPLVAVTHSRLGALPAFREGQFACARALLREGADANAGIGNRWPPHSVAAPDQANLLSALYGAAGINRDPALTSLLLDAGADPDDNESLYHSLENLDCTRLLLARGARIAGTNALGRALDMADPAALELLLAHGADPNEPVRGMVWRAWGSLLLRALGVRASPGHVAALLAAGADPHARTPGGIGAYRLAMQTGQSEAAEMLRATGAADSLTEDEAFVAACARSDEAAAREIQARRPDLPASLPPDRLRLLPDTVAWGAGPAARTMVELGWPIAARGGDWDASALNHAVFRGDPGLTAFLLAHGASWREAQGFGSDVLGTLSWASLNEPQGVAHPDWPGCARALLAQGLPRAERDPADPGRVLIDGRSMPFAEDVREVLLGGWE